MNKIIQNNFDYQFDIKDIPTKIFNVNLTEQQLKRLAYGLKTDVIEGLQTEDGVVNGRISLSRNDNGNISIDINEQQDTLYLPEQILGFKVTDLHKAELLEGKLLSVNFKGNQYLVGIDEELNKITISTDRQLGIPQTYLNYKLDETDKYFLANGKVTNQRLFQTNKGEYFLGRLSLTNDKMGMEIHDIKAISKERALEIKDTVNGSKIITDESKLIGVSSNADEKEFEQAIFRIAQDQSKRKEELEKQGLTVKENNVVVENVTNPHTNEDYKMVKNNKNNNVKYLSVSGGDDGFKIMPKQVFLKDTFKGVKIDEKMRMDFQNFKKVRINGALIKGKKVNVDIFKTKDGGFKTEFVKAPKINKTIPKALEREL